MKLITKEIQMREAERTHLAKYPLTAIQLEYLEVASLERQIVYHDILLKEHLILYALFMKGLIKYSIQGYIVRQSIEWGNEFEYDATVSIKDAGRMYLDELDRKGG